MSGRRRWDGRETLRGIGTEVRRGSGADLGVTLSPVQGALGPSLTFFWRSHPVSLRPRRWKDRGFREPAGGGDNLLFVSCYV